MKSGIPPTPPVNLSNPVGALPPPPPPPPPPGPPPALNPQAPKPPAGTDRSDLLAAIRLGTKLKPVENTEKKTVSAGGGIGGALNRVIQKSDDTEYQPPTEEANAKEWDDPTPTDLKSVLEAAFLKRRPAVRDDDSDEEEEKKNVEKEKEKLKSKPPLPPRPPKQEKKTEVLGITAPAENKAAGSSPLTVIIPPYVSIKDEEAFPPPPSPWIPEIQATQPFSPGLPPPPPPFSPPLPKSVEEKENENPLAGMPSPEKKLKEEIPNITDTLHEGITFSEKEQQDEKARMLEKSLNDLLTAFSENQAAEVASIRNKLLAVVNPTAKENKIGISKSLNDLPASVRLTEDRNTWDKSLLVLYKQVGNRKPSPKEVISFAMQNGLIGSKSDEFSAFAGSGMQYP